MANARPRPGKARVVERPAPSSTRPRLKKSLRAVAAVRRKVALPQLPQLPRISDYIGRDRLESVEGLAPEAALHARRNFRYGVLNGIMFSLVEALIAPSMVLAWYVNRLGAPNILVGLLPAILAGGWFLPQMLVASRVQGLPRMMHWYRRVGVVRCACLGLLVLATIAFAELPALSLLAFFTLFTIYAFAAGVTGIPWLEIVGKVVSPRRRGSFFAQRSFWGGLLALLAAGPIAAIMSEELWGLRFPYNFALLFALAGVGATAGVWAWSSIKEPPAAVEARPTRLGSVFKRGIEVLKHDRDFRSFTIVRVLMALASVADPFYVVYAKVRLGAPPATVGLYLGAVSLSSLLSNFLWGPLADRASNRTLVALSVSSMALAPIAALAVSLFIGAVDNNILYTAFALVFVVSGLTAGAARIVNNNLLLSIAPPAERATYIGFLNTLLGFAIFAPVLGGVLVDTIDYVGVFLLSLLLALLGAAAAGKMSRRRAADL